MRNCGNCFWCFTILDEEYSRKEYRGDDYDTDLNTSKAGDCCLGISHNGKYVCEAHDYIDGYNEEHYFSDNNIKSLKKVMSINSHK